MKQGRTMWDFLAEIDPFWLVIGIGIIFSSVATVLVEVFGKG